MGNRVKKFEATPFLIFGSVSSAKNGPVSNSITSKTKSVTGMFCPPTYSILTMSMEFDKTFQTEANTPLITKMTMKIFLNIFGRSYETRQIAKF